MAGLSESLQAQWSSKGPGPSLGHNSPVTWGRFTCSSLSSTLPSDLKTTTCRKGRGCSGLRRAPLGGPGAPEGAGQDHSHSSSCQSAAPPSSGRSACLWSRRGPARPGERKNRCGHPVMGQEAVQPLRAGTGSTLHPRTWQWLRKEGLLLILQPESRSMVTCPRTAHRHPLLQGQPAHPPPDSQGPGCQPQLCPMPQTLGSLPWPGHSSSPRGRCTSSHRRW